MTNITGSLISADGSLETALLVITPQGVHGAGPGVVHYIVIAGDLTGATSGYGESTGTIARREPLHLMPGKYSVLIQVTGGGSRTETWVVPDATPAIDIADLL